MKTTDFTFDRFVTLTNHIHPSLTYNDIPDYSHLLHKISMEFNNDILVTNLHISIDYQDISSSSITWYLRLKKDKIKYDFKSEAKYNITFKFGDSFEFTMPNMKYHNAICMPSFSNEFLSLISLNYIYDKVFTFLKESENKVVKVSIEEVDDNE